MMMTLEEIYHTENVNEGIIREALKQAEQRLTEQVDIQKTLHQRIHDTLKGYVTLSIFLIGIAATLHQTAPESPLFFALMATSAAFIAGVALLVFAQRPMNYGVLGSDPSIWLKPEIITGKPQALIKMLAYELHHAQDKINQSRKSNQHKSTLFSFSITVALIAPVIFAMLILLG
jgi:hypothetical protein